MEQQYCTLTQFACTSCVAASQSITINGEDYVNLDIVLRSMQPPGARDCTPPPPESSSSSSLIAVGGGANPTFASASASASASSSGAHASACCWPPFPVHSSIRLLLLYSVRVARVRVALTHEISLSLYHSLNLSLSHSLISSFF